MRMKNAEVPKQHLVVSDLARNKVTKAGQVHFVPNFMGIWIKVDILSQLALGLKCL